MIEDIGTTLWAGTTLAFLYAFMAHKFAWIPGSLTVRALGPFVLTSVVSVSMAVSVEYPRPGWRWLFYGALGLMFVVGMAAHSAIQDERILVEQVKGWRLKYEQNRLFLDQQLELNRRLGAAFTAMKAALAEPPGPERAKLIARYTAAREDLHQFADEQLELLKRLEELEEPPSSTG